MVEISRKLNFISPSWENIYDLCIDLAHKIKNSRNLPNSLIGVARGGLVPARIVADLLELRSIEVVHCEYYSYLDRKSKPRVGPINAAAVRGRDVLVVDDVADTGESLNAVEESIKSLGPKRVNTAVIYLKPWNKSRVDYHATETDAWIIFPWERFEAIRTLLQKGYSERELANTHIPPSIVSKLLSLSVTH
jgi:hypoxanthine phosphoribosyltransferase